MTPMETRFCKKNKKNINADNYDLNLLNDEYYIKLSTDNSVCSWPLPHKNISGFTLYVVNKLDP